MVAASNPDGNWLWQLATELVPAEDDQTDVLNDEVPPVWNRIRNRKTQPMVRGTEEVKEEAVDVPGSGVGMDSVLGAGVLVGKSQMEVREELSEINARRARVDLPPLAEPNSQAERNKRMRGRRGALHLNVRLLFNVPRKELEDILLEYQGPFGPVAEKDVDVRANVHVQVVSRPVICLR